MNQPRKFRRPAMLSAEQTEAIQGTEDPAESSIVAYEAARAFIDPHATDEHSADIRLKAAGEGPDEFAPLWQGQPGSTIPGILWRCYVMLQWWDADAAAIRAHYDCGKQTDYIHALYGDVEESADVFFDQARKVLHADSSVAFDRFLVLGARTFFVIAAGIADKCADDPGDADQTQAITAIADDFKDCLWTYLSSKRRV